MRQRLFIFLIVICVGLAYAPVRHGGFLWDDDSHITANPSIVGPLGLREIWSTAAANYFPLTTTSFWIQHAIWGLNPVPYHVVNVVMHALCALVLCAGLRELRVPGAELGALIWALHPVQVESVAWICELKNVQACLFYLLALWLFTRWLRAGRMVVGRDYVLAFVCAGLAILSKASTVMLPVVLGLAWWWLGGWRWRNLLWLAPFFAISAAASGWTIWEQKVHSMASGSEWSQTLPERIVLAGRVSWFYLGKLAWPQPLIFIYPRWSLDAASFIAWVPPVAAAAGLAILAFYRNGRARAGFFAAAYFVVSLFPVLGFFNVFFFRYSFVADHFQHLASIGPLVLAGAVLAKVAERFTIVAARWRWLATTPVLATLIAVSHRQCAIYRDHESLWSDTVARNPAAWIARINLGVVLTGKGQLNEAITHYRVVLAAGPGPGFAEAGTNLTGVLVNLSRYDEALAVVRQVIAVRPEIAEAHNSLGVALCHTGKHAEAVQAYATALRLKPDYAFAHLNLGDCFVHLGRPMDALVEYEAMARLAPNRPEGHRAVAQILVQAGRDTDAIGHFQTALRIAPDNFAANLGLADALNRLGRRAEAVGPAASAQRARPDSVEACAALGVALLGAGRAGDAVPAFEAALRLQPGNESLRANRAAALLQSGRAAEAVPYYEAIATAEPDSADAQNNLGSALLQAARLEEAIAHYRRALQLRPAFAEAHCNLALALGQAKRFAEAIQQCDEALRLRPDFPAAQQLREQFRAAAAAK